MRQILGVVSFSPSQSFERKSLPKRKPDTTQDQDLVRLYLDEIGRHPLLTKDDEARLAQAIEAGRDAAAQLTSGEKLTPAKKRELRKLVRGGEEATEVLRMEDTRMNYGG